METAVASSTEAQEFVRELRLLSGNLRAEYAAEREAHPIAHRNIVPLVQKDEPWSISRRLALAAGIALCACLGAIAIGTVQAWRDGTLAKRFSRRWRRPTVASNQALQTPVEGTSVDGLGPWKKSQLRRRAGRRKNWRQSPPSRLRPSISRRGSWPRRGRPRVRSRSTTSGAKRSSRSIPRATERSRRTRSWPRLDNPLSTFSIDVDTASYSNVRRFIEDGSLPAEGRGARRGDDQLFRLRLPAA